VEIEFDPNKYRANRLKHRVSLGLAAEMDLGAAVIEPDQRSGYGEDRLVALGPISGRLHLLAFTMRGEVMRVISLRKANARERRRYAQKDS
jgi:uncharacterized DUF497 family protein